MLWHLVTLEMLLHCVIKPLIIPLLIIKFYIPQLSGSQWRQYNEALATNSNCNLKNFFQVEFTHLNSLQIDMEECDIWLFNLSTQSSRNWVIWFCKWERLCSDLLAWKHIAQGRTQDFVRVGSFLRQLMNMCKHTSKKLNHVSVSMYFFFFLYTLCKKWVKLFFFQFYA